ncbi:TetR/AcrR family transcriptional regulator [Salsuginibacillus kocurii]|uniref:TetR/AcrR family transcriptional regulator n=1 Tax=Salsuginibacillus kocurii TaxID=427078 RepID=UPI00037F790D|nr:TetR/AcrR family transcriptional regulator [Salsuginibacillus kocurii]
MTSSGIKQVALTHFAQHGYEGTSLKDIAEGVGIKKPSLYNHFASKEDVFLAVVDDVFAAYVSHVNRCLKEAEGLGIERQLKEALLATCVFLSGDHFGRLYIRVLMFPPLQLKAEINARFAAFEGKTDEIFRSLFAKGVSEQFIRAGDIDQYLQAFYVMMDGITTEMFIYQKETVERKAEAAWRVFWHSIQAAQ